MHKINRRQVHSINRGSSVCYKKSSSLVLRVYVALYCAKLSRAQGFRYPCVISTGLMKIGVSRSCATCCLVLDVLFTCLVC